MLGLVALVALVVAFLGWSLVGAMTTPGNESLNAKWADWMRSHHAAFIVNHFEAYYYSHNAPHKGGQPRGLNALPPASRGTGAVAPTVTTPSVPVPDALPAPTAVPLVVSPALAGEGQWQPVGPLVRGVPGMYEAQFRADSIYTAEITTAVWIDPLLLRVSLVPGLTEPSGTWTHPPYIAPSDLPTVAAAFNGGFRFQDAKGGVFLEGRTAVPLRTGAASLVLYQDGRINIGAWGSEVNMTANVTAVLQNLVPLVDGGQLAPSATYKDASVWGSTLGANVVVARSGLGITANGALVYVAGPALTAKTLAESLQRAGAVRAMTLDINPEWVTFNFYTHPDPANPAVVDGIKLYPQMRRSATRYLPPTRESRDFFSISAPATG